MSARKVESPGAAQMFAVQSRQTRLTLLRDSVWIRKDGIEFRSESALPLWTEMTVVLEGNRNGNGKVNCNGVVVGCSGNRHIGYVVTMVFTGLSKASLDRLVHFAQAS